MSRASVYLVIAFAAALGARVVAPSDLYDNDQPKTVAYTVDMVQHGRWLQPRDMLERPTTKPPLYNWIGAPLLAVFGPSEFVLKLPSVLAAAAVVLVTLAMGRWMMRAEARAGLPPPGPDTTSPIPYLDVGAVAGVIWLASTIGMKQIYLARPDMVLAAALTGGWACATRCMRPAATGDDRPASVWRRQFGLWLCVALAALAKGPPALLLLLYVVLGAKLLAGRWSAVRRTGLAWGLPAALLIVGGWLYLAYSADPAGFRAGLVHDALEHRSTAAGPLATLLTILAELWRMPVQFIGRFLPWSVFVILALLHVPPRRWFRGPLGPAALWVLLGIAFFMLSPRQRPDYLVPVYGPAAILAAYWLVVVAAKYRVTPQRVELAGLAIIIGLAAYDWYFSDAARTGWGQNAVHFAHAVRSVTGSAGVGFDDVGYSPLPPLLGLNPPVAGDPPWVLRPIVDADPHDVPILISEPIPGVGSGAGAIGLFRASAP